MLHFRSSKLHIALPRFSNLFQVIHGTLTTVLFGRRCYVCIMSPYKPTVLMAEYASWTPCRGEARPVTLGAPIVRGRASPRSHSRGRIAVTRQRSSRRLLPVYDWCGRGGVRINPTGPALQQQQPTSHPPAIHVPSGPSPTREQGAMASEPDPRTARALASVDPRQRPFIEPQFPGPSRKLEAPRPALSGARLLYVSSLTG